MATTAVITITSPESTADLTAHIKRAAGDRAREVNSLMNYLNGLAIGIRSAKLDVQVAGGDSVAASGTVTFTGVGAASDTILINGVTFTAKASGATGNEWNVGASATLSAAALKAAINASATALVSGHVTADNVLGVLTVTAINKGVTGNAITLAKGVDSTSAMAVSGARLTGGTAATANEYKYGSTT